MRERIKGIEKETLIFQRYQEISNRGHLTEREQRLVGRVLREKDPTKKDRLLARSIRAEAAMRFVEVHRPRDSDPNDSGVPGGAAQDARRLTGGNKIEDPRYRS